MIKKISSITVFETDGFIALDKPSGLLSIPDRQQTEKSLKEYLQEKYTDIFTVHRLDRDTSGLILFAKTPEAHQYLSGLFMERQMEKTYLGIVLGKMRKPSGDLEYPIAEHRTEKAKMVVHRAGKPSHTGYETVEEHNRYSLVAFRLHTGRTHQIRVHAREAGNALACDPVYGDGKPIFLSAFKKKYNPGKFAGAEQPMLNRLALHSWRLGFSAMDGKRLDLEAPMPKEFRAVMQQQAKWE